MDIAEVNHMDHAAFVAAFGGVFEHSPWIADRAFDARPFADVGALHAAMRSVVESAARDEQLALLRAHPDLAGKEARAGTMTEASVDEQASAALDRLSPAEMDRIERLNGAYRTRHGFPFIIAVRHYTKDGILHEFERRLANDSETERIEGLRQVFAITQLRLQRLAGGEVAAAPQADDRLRAPLSA